MCRTVHKTYLGGGIPPMCGRGLSSEDFGHAILLVRLFCLLVRLYLTAKVSRYRARLLARSKSSDQGCVRSRLVDGSPGPGYRSLCQHTCALPSDPVTGWPPATGRRPPPPGMLLPSISLVSNPGRDQSPTKVQSNLTVQRIHASKVAGMRMRSYIWGPDEAEDKCQQMVVF